MHNIHYSLRGHRQSTPTKNRIDLKLTLRKKSHLALLSDLIRKKDGVGAIGESKDTLDSSDLKKKFLDFGRMMKISFWFLSLG